MDRVIQEPTMLTSFSEASYVTTNRAFGVTDSDAKPMFQVSGGISAEDALTRASHLLKCAQEAAYEFTDSGHPNTALVWRCLSW